MSNNLLNTTMTITPETTLNAIVARYPETLPILQRFGLDTCCGGALPLRDAAQHHGLDVEEILRALDSAAKEQDR
jgi:iron-sulfur cluster repair protein YtfE (RIC family)